MIENVNQFGSLSEPELNDFEKENGIQLPQDYRRFLLHYNGGRPTPNRNRTPDTLVAYILGMHNGPFYASLYKHINAYSTRLPLSSFSIATDPFGNLFIISVHPKSYGYIYFWDHEKESEIQDGHYVGNCTFVAYSFDHFINGLI